MYDDVDQYNSLLVVPVVKALPPDDLDICFGMKKIIMVSTSINNNQMVKKMPASDMRLMHI